MQALPRAQWRLKDQIGYWLGIGLGSGLSPLAPGTAGSLMVLPLLWLWLWLGSGISLMVMALMSVLGIWVCGHAAQLMGVHDDPHIVWDEFCGQSLALWPVVYWAAGSGWSPEMWMDALVAFLAFRLFDVWKPWPISWLDRQVEGGLGIMLDDVVAGVFAALGTALWLQAGRPVLQPLMGWQ